eukprot:12833813-Heterocapsa_arctica.AAC.1
MMEDEPEKKEPELEESDSPNEDKAKSMMTETMANHIADMIIASWQTDLRKIEEAEGHREHECGSQGDDRGRAQRD